MADILIYGTLRNNTSSHVIAKTDQIQDTKLNKSQETINQEVNTKLASGVATLGSDGKVPASMLPSYVDDVVEFGGIVDLAISIGEQLPPVPQAKNIVFVKRVRDAVISKPVFKFCISVGSGVYVSYESENKQNLPEGAVPVVGKIYVDVNTNKCYRWSGSDLVEISQGVQLGESAQTAFRGDQGKVAYAHAQAKGAAFGQGLYKIATNAEGHVTAAAAVTKADITALGIPGEQAVIPFGGVYFSLKAPTIENTSSAKADTSNLMFVVTPVGQIGKPIGSDNNFYHVIDGKFYLPAPLIGPNKNALYVDVNENKVYRADMSSRMLVEVGSPDPQTLTDAEIDAICK